MGLIGEGRQLTKSGVGIWEVTSNRKKYKKRWMRKTKKKCERLINGKGGRRGGREEEKFYFF